MKCKFHIIYDFKEGPYGGGNQFLKALRNAARKAGVYAEFVEDADFFLLNGYPFSNNIILKHLLILKSRFPKVPFIYRIDGPTCLVRGSSKDFDILLKYIADALMDGVVFQSDWSKQKNNDIVGLKCERTTVIPNAPDSNIFNQNEKSAFIENGKIRLIATSWSPNIRKGFKYYEYLDNHLDFDTYSMTFVGNTPIRFSNIKTVEPVTSLELSHLLKEHDIFVTASQNDPCSNSLIEALATGLPSVVINDGGHPELLGKGGVTFNTEKELLIALDDVAQNYHKYASALPFFNMSYALNRYVSFGEFICNAVFDGSCKIKRLTIWTKTLLQFAMIYLDAKRFLIRIKNKISRTFKSISIKS